VINDQITNNRTLKLTVKQISQHSDELACTNKYTYEVILRGEIKGKLTNLNVMLTKLGLAICDNMSIFDGEVEDGEKAGLSTKLNLNEVKYVPKDRGPTLLDIDISSFIVTSRAKVITGKQPKNSVVCKVTNAISPNEIWLLDIVDSNQYYPAFQQRLAARYTDMDGIMENGQEAESAVVWKVNDYCVVRKRVTVKEWEYFRARVVSRSEKTGKYKLICLDNGNYEECVSEANMLVMLDEYRYVFFFYRTLSGYNTNDCYEKYS
jgi:hypothetical protein